jgi:hypothetical protein
MSHLNDHAERAAITAAMDRLLAGTPTRSTGSLTVVQLAAEAGVKRWVLTHKHTDLRDDFQHRAQAASTLPPAFQHLEAQITDLRANNQRLRDRNRELEERNELYAMVINELSIQLHHASPGTGHPGNVTQLRRPQQA